MNFYVLFIFAFGFADEQFSVNPYPPSAGSSYGEYSSGPYGDVLHMQPAVLSSPGLGDLSVATENHWPNNLITYSYSVEITDDDKGLIEGAIDEIRSASCLRYDHCPTCSDRIQFGKSKAGCFSEWLGRKGGVQVVNLGTGCMYHGIAVHENLHAVGFYHEMARPDRDLHVRVLLENIRPDWRAQFTIFSNPTAIVGNFDYDSVMMYAAKDPYVGINADTPYMLPLDDPNALPRFGQRRGLSLEDIRKINIAFCGGQGPTPPPVPTTAPPTPEPSTRRPLDGVSIWPNRQIVYTFRSGGASWAVEKIRSVIQSIESRTCVRFLDCASCNDRVEIRLGPGTQCSSSDYGKNTRGGIQTVTLQYDCLVKQTVTMLELAMGVQFTGSKRRRRQNNNDLTSSEAAEINVSYCS